MIWEQFLLLWTIKGICSFLCLSMAAVWERYRLQGLTSYSGVKQNSHCENTQMQQEAVKSGEGLKGNTRVTGITNPCRCLERSFVWSWDPVGHQNRLFPCPELGGITQKIQLLKAPWAGPQSGLVFRSLQNYTLSITCWDKLKWIGLIELTGHRIKWQLQSGLKTNKCINFPCL